jgi:hypothetical protein
VKFRSIVLFLALATVAPCSGAVLYELTGTSSVTGTPFAVSFAETLPGFILGGITVPAVQLDACSTGFEVCSQVSFEAVSSHDPGFSHVEFSTTTTSTLFFFDLGALGSPGVYNTVFGAGTGTLTVTAVIPEPGSITLLMLAAGLLAVRRFAR